MSNLGKKINPLELVSREGFAFSQIPAFVGINAALLLSFLNPVLMGSFAAGSGTLLALQIWRKQRWRESIRAGKLTEEITRAAERYLTYLDRISKNLSSGISVTESLKQLEKDLVSLESDFNKLIAQWERLNSDPKKKGRIDRVADRDQLKTNRASLPKDALLILNLHDLGVKVVSLRGRFAKAKLEKGKITDPVTFYIAKQNALKEKLNNLISLEELETLKEEMSKLKEEVSKVSKLPIYADTEIKQDLEDIISNFLIDEGQEQSKQSELEANMKSAERLTSFKTKIDEFRDEVLHFATLSEDKRDNEFDSLMEKYSTLVRYLNIYSTDRKQGLVNSDTTALRQYFEEQIEEDVFRKHIQPILNQRNVNLDEDWLQEGQDGSTAPPPPLPAPSMPTTTQSSSSTSELSPQEETEFNLEEAESQVGKLLNEWGEKDNQNYLQNEEKIKWAWFFGVYEALSDSKIKTMIDTTVTDWAKQDGNENGVYSDPNMQKMQFGEATRQVIQVIRDRDRLIVQSNDADIPVPRRTAPSESVPVASVPTTTSESAPVAPAPPPPPPPPPRKTKSQSPPKPEEPGRSKKAWSRLFLEDEDNLTTVSPVTSPVAQPKSDGKTVSENIEKLASRFPSLGSDLNSDKFDMPAGPDITPVPPKTESTSKGKRRGLFSGLFSRTSKKQEKEIMPAAAQSAHGSDQSVSVRAHAPAEPVAASPSMGGDTLHSIVRATEAIPRAQLKQEKQQSPDQEHDIILGLVNEIPDLLLDGKIGGLLYYDKATNGPQKYKGKPIFADDELKSPLNPLDTEFRRIASEYGNLGEYSRILLREGSSHKLRTELQRSTDPAESKSPYLKYHENGARTIDYLGQDTNYHVSDEALQETVVIKVVKLNKDDRQFRIFIHQYQTPLAHDSRSHITRFNIGFNLSTENYLKFSTLLKQNPRSIRAFMLALLPNIFKDTLKEPKRLILDNDLGDTCSLQVLKSQPNHTLVFEGNFREFDLTEQTRLKEPEATERSTQSSQSSAESASSAQAPAEPTSSMAETQLSIPRATTEFEIPELNAENQEQELSEDELLEILTSISGNQQALIQLLPVFSQDGKKTLTEDDKNKFTAQQKLITDLKRNLSKKTNLNQNILDYFLKQIEDLLRECKSVLVYLAFIENVHEDEKQPMRELETAYIELLQVLSSKISNPPSAQESTSESSMKTTQTGIPTQVLPVLPPTTSETSEKAAIIDEFFSRLTDAEPEEQTPHSAGGATSVPNPESPARGLEVLTEDNYRTLFDVDSNTGDFEKRGSNAMFNAVEEIVWPDSWDRAFFSSVTSMQVIIFPNVKKITITNLNARNALLAYNSFFARMLPSLERIEIQNLSTDTGLSGPARYTGIQGLLANLSYMPKFRTITISTSHPLYRDIDFELRERQSWSQNSARISIVTT